MTRTEKSETDSDPTSRTTHRRLWRRVWLGVILLAILTPVVLWIAIDQAGKREWWEARVRLRSHGEATTIEELNLPTREEVPDEDNFCAMPWMIANEDGSESAAMAEMTEKLAIFGGSTKEPKLLQQARGNPMLGIPGDIAAVDRMIALNAGERGVTLDESKLQEAGDDPVALSAAYLDLFEPYYKTADAAREKPQAFFLPPFETRLEAANGWTYGVYTSGFNASQNFCNYLTTKVLLAIRSGDYETALRSLEIGRRFAEAAASEENLIGGLVSVTGFSMMLRSIVTCLWDDSFKKDRARLQHLQSILQDWDLHEVLAQSLRGEMVFSCDGMQLISRNPRDLPADLGLSPAFGALIPPGWWNSNMAYYADVFDRTLLESCRSGNHADLLAAARRLDTEISSLNRIERLSRMIVVMTLASFDRTIWKFSYNEACRRQAIIVCALYRYRIDHHGRFPDTLDALVPAYLESVPNDPIDAAPMRYTSPSNTDTSFKLYSIGHDGSDDGGALKLDPDRLERTRVDRDSYIGDWPWPVQPRQLTVGETSE